MNEEQTSRTALLIGREGVEKLMNSRVAIFGIGGVGGFAAEALVRSGIGTIDLIDHDTVAPSNLNRQIIATCDTIGMLKVDAAEARFKSINPDCVIHKHPVFYTRENAEAFDFSLFDHVVDAIDTVSGKMAIIERAYTAGTPVISSMGAGNKLDPTAFELADINETSVCPLARVIRTECRKRGIKHLRVVYSKEKPVKSTGGKEQTVEAGRRSVPGSVAFVPSVAGLIIAGEVVRCLLNKQ